MITLETRDDQTGEALTINRFLERCGNQYTAVKTQQYAIMDYLLIRDNHVTNYLEIKNRKETREQIQQYGGLMLKHRKLLEAQTLSRQMQTATHVIYGFENGHGELWIANTHDLTGLTPQDPPRRRNYRGLPCDEEQVVYLDWTQHLRRVA